MDSTRLIITNTDLNQLFIVIKSFIMSGYMNNIVIEIFPHPQSPVMKKILIAFDGTQFSEGAFEFARQLNDLQPVLLTGVFLPQLSYTNLSNYTSAMSGPLFVPIIDEQDENLHQKNIERFQRLCIKNNMAFRVHNDYNDFALPELKKETRYADLLIISSEKFFKNLMSGNISDYMADAIHEAECPVMVIPEKFFFPKRNVIAYDGSASSVFAMKQFAYIFQELAGNETLLVYSKEEGDLKLPDEDYIEELATQHYKDLTIMKLELNPKKYFNTWLQKEDHPILICGAFGRSSISQVFKKSFVTEVIADHQLPVFIAHR